MLQFPNITEFISNQQKQPGRLIHNLMQSLLSHFKTQCCCIQKPLLRQRSDKQITFDLRQNKNKQKIIDIGDIRKQYMKRRMMESIEEEHREKRVYGHQEASQEKIRASYDNIKTSDNRIEKYLEKQCQAVSRFIVQNINENNPYRQAIKTQNGKYLLSSKKKNRSQSKTKKLSITCVNFAKPSQMISLGGRRVIQQEKILNNFVENRRQMQDKSNLQEMTNYEGFLIKRNSQDELARTNYQENKVKQRRSISYHLISLKTPSNSKHITFSHQQHSNSYFSNKCQSLIITTHSRQSNSISNVYNGQLSHSTTIEESKGSVKKWQSQLEKNDIIVNVESRQYNGRYINGNENENCIQMVKNGSDFKENDKSDRNDTQLQKNRRQRKIHCSNCEDKQNNLNLLNAVNPYRLTDCNQQYSSYLKRVIPPSLKQTPPRVPKILSKGSQSQCFSNHTKHQSLSLEIDSLSKKLHQLKKEQNQLIDQLHEQKEQFASLFGQIQRKRTQMVKSCQERLQDIHQLVGLIYNSELQHNSQ